MAPNPRRFVDQANRLALKWQLWVNRYKKCVTWDDVPAGTNVGIDAVPEYSADFTLSWGTSSVPPLGDTREVFARPYPAVGSNTGANSPPNVLSLLPTGDPVIKTYNGVGALIIEFSKPRRFVKLRVKPLSDIGALPPSAFYWDSLAPGVPTGQFYVPASVTDWTDITFAVPTASILVVMFEDGYLDDLCYA